MCHFGIFGVIAYNVCDYMQPLGDLEELVLLGVQVYEPTADCSSLKHRLEMAGRLVSRGAMATVLRRLEAKGALSSVLVPYDTFEPESGRGRTIRYYKLSDLGRAALERAEVAREIVRFGRR